MKGVIVCKSNFLSFFVFSQDELKHKNDVEFVCVKVRMQFHSRDIFISNEFQDVTDYRNKKFYTADGDHTNQRQFMHGVL